MATKTLSEQLREHKAYLGKYPGHDRNGWVLCLPIGQGLIESDDHAANHGRLYQTRAKAEEAAREWLSRI